MIKPGIFKCIRPSGTAFTVGKKYIEDVEKPLPGDYKIGEIPLISDNGNTYFVKILNFQEVDPFILKIRKFSWNKIKTILIPLFFWLRVVVYYSSAFYIAYLYFTTHDFIITIPMCLIFISFLMADKLLIKL